jgi:serine/threonine-protein kinase
VPPTPAHAPQAHEDGADLAPGLRLLDRYTIVDKVGSGGMATIYRATDERLERIVCVKLLRLVLEGAGGSASGPLGVYQTTYTHFLQEALALSKLQHPNTLRIYDFGYTLDARPLQISEFLDGGNLETLVRARGRFTPEETRAVLERICGAVTEAHQHGILHRDIKPSNILFARIAAADEPGNGGALREAGHALVPKLADFGISSSRVRKGSNPDVDAEALSSVALFSPRWAAPEQIEGAVESPATDVYALGLLTAYMLAGRVPFGDADAKAHFDERITGDTYADLRLAALDLDPEVQRVLVSALRAEPAQRTPSPSVFFEQVANALTPVERKPRPNRPSFESITLVYEGLPERSRDAQPVAPPERAATAGGRQVRIVEARDPIDFTLHLPAPAVGGPTPVRFRAALLPSPGPEGFSLHLKGLNCFVVRRGARPGEGGGGRPTPAITASEDGEADFVAGGGREVLASVRWSFGRGSDVGLAAGRAFDIGNEVLVIPFSQASQAVAIDLGPRREIIAMCRHN